MRFRLFGAAAVGGVAAMLCVSPILADERIGSWLIVDNVPDAIYLVDEIDFHTPLDFHRAMEERPNARTIILNSPGGSVSDGLLVAEDVHERGFNTYIPQGQGCYSACSYIFLAGISRRADGELGVHQISSDVQSNANMQFTVSDVLHVLEQFNTPPELIDRMFRTPSESIYVFTAAELVSLGINRDGAQTGGATTASSAPLQQSGKWIALYAGIDFYGDDISGDARNAAAFRASPEISSP